jgi:hypothetical protein
MKNNQRIVEETVVARNRWKIDLAAAVDRRILALIMEFAENQVCFSQVRLMWARGSYERPSEKGGLIIKEGIC